MANSAMAFCIAYIAVTALFFLATALMGKVFGFEATVFYYGVKFSNAMDKWGRLNITLIYSIGVLVTLFAGIFSAYLFYKLKKRNLVLNLVFVWGMIISGSIISAQGLIMIMGAEEYNSPFYQNLAVVAAWLRIPSLLSNVLAFPFFIFGAFLTLYYSRPFLTMAYSFHKVNKTSRKIKFFVETSLIPFLPGAVIVLLTTFPHNMWVTIVYIAFIGFSLLLSIVALRLQMIKTDEMLRYENLQKINFPLIVILGLMLTFIYLTWQGLHLW